LTEKTEIDVNASILRTIKRAGCATGETAAGLNHVRKEQEPRLLVLAAHLPEGVFPGVFGIGENDSNEFRCLVARRLTVDLRRLRYLRLLLRIKERLRIPAEREIKNYENDGANSAAHNEASPTRSASVFNIFAFSSPLPKHLSRIVARDSLAPTKFRDSHAPSRCYGSVPDIGQPTSDI